MKVKHFHGVSLIVKQDPVDRLKRIRAWLRRSLDASIRASTAPRRQPCEFAFAMRVIAAMLSGRIGFRTARIGTRPVFQAFSLAVKLMR